MDKRQEKQALRQEVAARKRTYTGTELAKRSEKILAAVEETDLFRSARCVALYHALPGEVQTAPFIERWYKEKRLLLPLVVGDDLRLLLYEGEESLRPGPFGILEPKADGVEPPKEEIDMIIVPGVAFDTDRNRLGRGRGYYDRLLATIKAPAIGICFGFQLFPHIPTEPFDRKMDHLITDTGCF